MKKLLVVFLVLFLSGCGAPASISTPGNEAVEVSPVIHRVEDKEAGVVCWVYFQTAIDCLPISETRLSR